jgi:hypothetical protein
MFSKDDEVVGALLLLGVKGPAGSFQIVAEAFREGILDVPDFGRRDGKKSLNMPKTTCNSLM